MPARIEKRVSLVNVASGMAAAGWIAATDAPVPSNKKWNVNAIFQSVDAAATRNAALAIAGGIPTHGLSGLPLGPAITADTAWAVSPGGTYIAFAISGTRIDLYARLGQTGLEYVDTYNLTGGTGWQDIAFSPDERWMAVLNAGFANVFTVPVSSSGFGTATNSAATGAAVVAGFGGFLGWSPTGAFIAAANAGAAATRVQVASFSNGTFGAWVNAPNVVATDTFVGAAPVWAPDESALAILLAQNAIRTALYGWKWVAGAFSGVAQVVTTAPITSTGQTFQGSLEWSSQVSPTLLIGGTTTTTVGGTSATPFVVPWTGTTWGTVVAPASGWSNNMKCAGVAWLTPLMLAGVGVTIGPAAEANVWSFTPAGAAIARLSTVAPVTLPPSTGLGNNRMALIDGQVWRYNAARTGIILETFLAPAVIIFPIIAIAANSRQPISGLTLEAGERLLVGTPANTDKYAMAISAIEIG